MNYEPELDATPHCDKEHVSRYRQIIGILRWDRAQAIQHLDRSCIAITIPSGPSRGTLGSTILDCKLPSPISYAAIGDEPFNARRG